MLKLETVLNPAFFGCENVPVINLTKGGTGFLERSNMAYAAGKKWFLNHKGDRVLVIVNYDFALNIFSFVRHYGFDKVIFNNTDYPSYCLYTFDRYVEYWINYYVNNEFSRHNGPARFHYIETPFLYPDVPRKPLPLGRG